MDSREPTTNLNSFAVLKVVGSGICCSVGYSAAAASCALRASVDNFQESDFVCDDGSPIRVARLSGEDRWGFGRLARWAQFAISECLANVEPNIRKTIPIVLLTSASNRSTNTEYANFETIRAAQATLGLRFARGTKRIAGGRAVFGCGLIYAQELLMSGKARKVMILGLDSFLSSADIAYYLSGERLLVPGNSDGFIPGEAAAAVVLELAKSENGGEREGLHIMGIGEAEEIGRPDGSVPSRAQGLSSSITKALAQSQLKLNEVSFRISDQNGEAFFAKEAANALTRVVEPCGAIPELLTVADCVGEVGAAAGPLMMAWMHNFLRHYDAPGTTGLIHLASDEGPRCAIVLKQYK